MAKFQKNFAPTATTVGVSQSYPVVAATDSKVVEASKKFGLNMKETVALTMLVTMIGLSGNANAAEGTTFALDVTSIISGIGTLVTLVTSIGLAFLSVVLVIKAFKYIKSAM